MKTQTRIDIFVCVQGVKETWVSKSKEGADIVDSFTFTTGFLSYTCWWSSYSYTLTSFIQIHIHIIILWSYTSTLLPSSSIHWSVVKSHTLKAAIIISQNRESFLIVTSHRCHIDIWGSAAAGVVTRKDDFSVFSHFLLCWKTSLKYSWDMLCNTCI